jgi:serine protease Do
MPAYLFCRRVLIALFVVMAPLSQAAARGTPDSFADLADKLLPTVVSIATSQTL